MCIRHARNALTEAEIRAAVICDDESGIAAFMWVDLVMLVLRERNYGLLHGRRRFAIYVRRRVGRNGIALAVRESNMRIGISKTAFVAPVAVINNAR